jgi:hypothetical protein
MNFREILNTEMNEGTKGKFEGKMDTFMNGFLNPDEKFIKAVKVALDKANQISLKNLNKVYNFRPVSNGLMYSYEFDKIGEVIVRYTMSTKVIAVALQTGGTRLNKFTDVKI